VANNRIKTHELEAHFTDAAAKQERAAPSIAMAASVPNKSACQGCNRSRRQQPGLRRAIGGLDALICSEKTLGIAIDGFL
jgi:hypothetical protein